MDQAVYRAVESENHDEILFGSSKGSKIERMLKPFSYLPFLPKRCLFYKKMLFMIRLDN